MSKSLMFNTAADPLGRAPLTMSPGTIAISAIMDGPNMRAIAVAACLTLALSACGGGGGGSSVKPTPPPSGGVAVDPPTVYIATGTTLTVKNGESSKPVIMASASVLDNAGTVGGPSVDIGVKAGGDTSSTKVINRDGGRIEGKSFGLQLWGAFPTIENRGAGTLIRSDGVAIKYIDRGISNTITNSDGATIQGGKIAIHLQRGGTIKNGAGSTIEATGTTVGDCGAGGSCSIYVSPDTTNTDLSREAYLENAGTIIGNVQLDPLARNQVTLGAGGTIIGDLAIGRGSLWLDGDAGTTQRFSAAVTGATTYSGVLEKNGAGTWILDTPSVLGTGDYQSAQINAGTLQIGNGGTEGPSAIKSVSADVGARLVFNRSDDFAFDGTFTRGGAIVQVGTGLLTLSLKDGSSVGLLAINAGSRMQITHSPSANVNNDGELTFQSPYETYWRGDISGAGSIVQNGAAHLVLAGENTYSGMTIVNSGSLEVRRGLVGGVEVNEGGRLIAGTVELDGYLARIGGSLYNAGRVMITQGDPIIWGGNAVRGDYVIGGDYVQSATGIFSVTLGDKLDIAGAARIEGGTLEVRGAARGYVANTHTDVLTAAGGVTGTFDYLVKGAGVVFTSSTIHYGANSVWLDTTGLDVTTAAAGNGIGYTPVSMSSAVRVQGAFDQLNDRIAMGTLADVPDGFLHSAGQFQRAPTIAAAQASLRSLSGQMHAASVAMTFRGIDAGNLALSDHLDGQREGATGMWAKQLGSGGGMARSGFDSVGFQQAGWLVGSDYRIGNSGVAGFAFGQGVGRQLLDQGLDRDDNRRSDGMLYAGLMSGSWYMRGRLGYGQFHVDTSRQLLLGDNVEGVWARYDGRYQTAHVESGFHVDRGYARIVPFMSLEYARSDRDAFAERGAGGFGLRSNAQAMERWRAGVGVRAGNRWNLGNGRSVTLGARAEWRHTLASSGDMAEASFVGLQQWTPLSGIGLSHYSGVFGIGLDARLSRYATLKLAYDYENGQYDTAQGLSAGLNIAF